MSTVYNRINRFTFKNDVQRVETELQQNPDFNINEQNNSGWTVLMSAAYRSRPEIMELFIKAGADMYLKDAKGETAFDKAANRGHGQAVQILREAFERARHERVQSAQAYLRVHAVKSKLRAGPRP
jgi:ankyrin repeat protein